MIKTCQNFFVSHAKLFGIWKIFFQFENTQIQIALLYTLETPPSFSSQIIGRDRTTTDIFHSISRHQTLWSRIGWTLTYVEVDCFSKAQWGWWNKYLLLNVFSLSVDQGFLQKFGNLHCPQKATLKPSCVLHIKDYFSSQKFAKKVFFTFVFRREATSKLGILQLNFHST